MPRLLDFLGLDVTYETGDTLYIFDDENNWVTYTLHYIDSTHFRLGDSPMSVWHIREFADSLALNGQTIYVEAQK